MIINVFIFSLVFIVIGIFLVFAIIIKDIKNGKYKVEDSILEKEAEEKYGKLYPEHSIEDLKNEIEKIVEIFVAGEESNRYTETLRQKAQNDERIQEINDAIIENVELVKYVDDVLKARVKYKNYEYEYTLILSFGTVTGGRVFLNDYFVFKNKIEVA